PRGVVRPRVAGTKLGHADETEREVAAPAVRGRQAADLAHGLWVVEANTAAGVANALLEHARGELVVEHDPVRLARHLLRREPATAKPEQVSGGPGPQHQVDHVPRAQPEAELREH